ncbi:MAG: hypothetical protein ACLVJ6_16290 [Merdibacter sp.]
MAGFEIRLKAPFRDHLTSSKTERRQIASTADFDYDRLGAAIYGDYAG